MKNTKDTTEQTIRSNGIQVARMINNAMQATADRLGRSWFSASGKAKRNIYESLGYIKEPVFNDYMARFKRGDIAKRVVSAPVDASWRLQPTLSEVKDKSVKKDTRFEAAWAALIKRINVYHYLARADKIAGIGRYGILLMGFNDGANMSEPVDDKVGGTQRDLLYLMPYTEDNAVVQVWDVDHQSPRYGLPKMYQVTMNNFNSYGGQHSTQTMLVHHSRVIHLAEGTTDNDVYGTPRLEACFNRLQDLELVAGGSGEMFWRGALPGYNFKIDADADIGTIDTVDLKKQIEDYTHGLQRILRTQGMDAQSLAPQVSTPKDHVDVQLKLISAATGIPLRILTGSERGELASSQDDINWNTRVDERREQYVEPMILRVFIQRLIDVGVLDAPGDDGFTITWPSLFTPNASDRAETAKKKTEALATYVNALGADHIIPPEIFLTDFLEYDEERISEIASVLEGYVGDEPETVPGDIENNGHGIQSGGNNENNR